MIELSTDHSSFDCKQPHQKTLNDKSKSWKKVAIRSGVILGILSYFITFDVASAQSTVYLHCEEAAMDGNTQFTNFCNVLESATGPNHQYAAECISYENTNQSAQINFCDSAFGG